MSLFIFLKNICFQKDIDLKIKNYSIVYNKTFMLILKKYWLILCYLYYIFYCFIKSKIK